MAKTKILASTPTKVLATILEEIRGLRREFSLLFPQEKLSDFAHPERIKRSFKKALEKYPPLSVWR